MLGWSKSGLRAAYDAKSGASNGGASGQKLYWFPPPVDPQYSVDVGRQMLVGTALWFGGLILVMVVISTIVGALG